MCHDAFIPDDRLHDFKNTDWSLRCDMLHTGFNFVYYL